MAAPASPDPEERVPNKRPKPDEAQDEPRPHAGYPPQQQRYPPPHYGGGRHPPPPPPGWGHQYGNGPPPPHSGYPMYSQRGPPPPPPGDRPDYYRNSGPPPHIARTSQPPGQSPPDGIGDDRSPYPGWSPHGPPPPQWHNPSSYGPPPPPSQAPWQGHSGPPPSIHQQQQGPGSSSASTGPMHPSSAPPPPSGNWGSGSNRSPPRSGRGGHSDAPFGRHELDMSYMTSRSVGTGNNMDDDVEGSSTGGSTKDKGRGSYKCGRCGVPKKGHVCPYQPKLKRRSDEPLPETRNAAIQVEMDEFMTLRRLNLKIQGLPESYATEPYMGESLVIGEPIQAMPEPMHPEPMLTSDHLQPIPARLPPDAMMMNSGHPPHSMPAVHMSLDDELIDPLTDSPSGPDVPRSSPLPVHSKDVALGDDVIDPESKPLAMDEEKKE